MEMYITKNYGPITKNITKPLVCILFLKQLMLAISLFQNIILISSGFFGVYLMFRLIGRKTKLMGCYIYWILSGAMMFMTFLSLKLDIFSFQPILYRAVSPLFFFTPPALYLFFFSLVNTSITTRKIFTHSIPFVLSLIYSLYVILDHRQDVINEIRMLQIELNNPNFVSLDRPFDMEIVFYFCRSLLGLFYIRLIDKMLLESTNTRIITGWKKLFLPIKINIYAITIFFLANQIILRVFGYTIPRFYIINVSAIIASGMLFWHILLAIKDLENPESIFNDQIKPSVPTIQAPEKILFILKQISEQKMYQDPLVSVGSIANKFDMSEEKFASEFNNNIPFSFSSYINYLRLINFEKNSNSKYSKEANILNAGFNSRASYYQWEKRRAKLALQIDPILESFEPLT